MFEVKGSGVISVVDFVKSRFGPEGHARWLAALSPAARELATQTLLTTSWYPGPLSMELRKAICDLFFAGDVRGARELGRFSADRGLRGIYRMAVKLGSPRWVAERASTVFESYFRPGTVSIDWQSKTSGYVSFSHRLDEHGIMAEVFSGFVQVALELSGAKQVVIERSTRPRDANVGPEMLARWEI